jgi:lipoate-protein ligase A
MAVDLAIQRARAEGRVPATLRIYSFQPPAVSLGRFQAPEDVDLEACAGFGIDVCRRPTGGRAVLHDDEVTYSVVASTRDGLPRGVAASYRHLGAALTSAYERLGISAHLSAGRRGDAASASCYLQATRADLVADGAKLSGSAQVWDGDVCLQHGSFVLGRDVRKEAAVLRLDSGATDTLAAETVTIEQASGRRPPRDEVTAAVREAFAEVLGVELDEGELTEGELRWAGALERAAVVFESVPGTGAQHEVEVDAQRRPSDRIEHVREVR